MSAILALSVVISSFSTDIIFLLSLPLFVKCGLTDFQNVLVFLPRLCPDSQNTPFKPFFVCLTHSFLNFLYLFQLSTVLFFKKAFFCLDLFIIIFLNCLVINGE